MHDVEAVEVRRGVADAGEVGAHFREGGGVGADAGFAAGFDYGEGGLQGVEGVDCVVVGAGAACGGCGCGCGHGAGCDEIGFERGEGEVSGEDEVVWEVVMFLRWG